MEFEKRRIARLKKADKQFTKWEKIVTLGDALGLVLPACMKPVVQAEATE